VTGRPRGTLERYCRRLHHDKEVVGRTVSGGCAECGREYDKFRKRRDNSLLAPRRLFSVVKKRGWSWDYVVVLYADERGVTLGGAHLAVRRLRQSRGLTIDQADMWCLLLGTDLAVVYPEAYRFPKGQVVA